MSCTTTLDDVERCTVTIPNTVPTRSGYRFLGWSFEDPEAREVDLTVGDEFKFDEPFSEDMSFTLYAVWQREYTYTVEFYANTMDTVEGMPDDLSYGPTLEVEHDFTVPRQIPRRSGYKFKGWRMNSDNSEIYVAGDIVKVEPDATTIMLFAVWEEGSGDNDSGEGESSGTGDNSGRSSGGNDGDVAIPNTGASEKGAGNGVETVWTLIGAVALTLVGVVALRRKHARVGFEKK